MPRPSLRARLVIAAAAAVLSATALPLIGHPGAYAAATGP